MKRTDEQVRKAVLRMFNNRKHREAFYTSLLNYWIKYDLTQDQCDYLEEAKRFVN